MKIKVGILGSCVSRDSFNSLFNPNYKDDFEVVVSGQRVSLISLMSKPIKYEESLFNPNKIKSFVYENIKYDLEKTFLLDLVKYKPDCLIIDNYLEVIFGILCFNGSIITYNKWDLPKTPFFDNLEEYNILTMMENPEEYFKMWTYYCKDFFNFLNENCPDMKIIINKTQALDKFKDETGNVYINSKLTEISNKVNVNWNKLDNFIISNFDVEVLNFDFNTIFLDPNHPWGIGHVHYTNNYYNSLIQQVKYIVLDKTIEK